MAKRNGKGRNGKGNDSDDQPDLFGGRKDRDEAMERVLQNAGDEWRQRADDAIRSLRQTYPTGLASGEDIRVHVRRIAGKPHHHNVWGGFINSLVRGGMLAPTGVWVPMRIRSSHARKTPQYRILL